jgi:hypothetical protein
VPDLPQPQASPAPHGQAAEDAAAGDHTETQDGADARSPGRDETREWTDFATFWLNARSTHPALDDDRGGDE